MTSLTVRRLSLTVIALSLASACGGSPAASSTTSASSGSETETSSTSEGGGDSAAASDEFQLSSSDSAGQAHGDHPSEITASATQAAMRLFVMDPDEGASTGVVIKLTGPDGHSYYTGETDSVGYAEVLVPAGQRYDLEYLSLGRRSTRAHVDVPAGANQDIRLTLRHRRFRRAPHAELTTPEPGAPPPPAEGLVLDGILFGRGSASIEAESNPRLDRVVEYMTHMASARIRIAGHTDNVGDARRNQQLSESRAEAVRAYLISHGIDASRVEAIGYGDAHPVATNDTEEGRAQNRRIEAEEL